MEFVAEKAMGALGRIVIPEDLRESHNLHPGTPVGIYSDGDRIILRSHKQPPESGGCSICGSHHNIAMITHGKAICKFCVMQIKEVDNATV